MRSVLLNYASSVNKREDADGFVYSHSKSVNVCKFDTTRVYIENERQYCGLKTKTEVAREQDDTFPLNLCLKTKTYAQMEQDDQGSLCYE